MRFISDLGFLAPGRAGAGQPEAPAEPIDLAALFAGGAAGAWYDFTDLSTLWTDTNGTVPATGPDQRIARVTDKSGNGRDLRQGLSSYRPRLGRVPRGGRRNLLGYTEDFHSWVAEAGAIRLAADSIFLPGTVNSPLQSGNRVYQRFQSGRIPGQPYTAQVVVPGASGWSDPAAVLRIALATTEGAVELAEVTAAADPQHIVLHLAPASTGSDIGLYFNADRDLTITGLARPQIEFGTVATGYQRVNGLRDVTEEGVESVWFLDFTGGSVHLPTASTIFDMSADPRMLLAAAFQPLAGDVTSTVVQHHPGYGSAGGASLKLETGTWLAPHLAFGGMPSGGTAVRRAAELGPEMLDGVPRAVVGRIDYGAAPGQVVRLRSAGVDHAQTLGTEEPSAGVPGSGGLRIGGTGSGEGFDGALYGVLVLGGDVSDATAQGVEAALRQAAGIWA